MKPVNLERYTIEELQLVYALSISKASEIFDRFGGDKSAIDKIMKKIPHREDVDHR